MHSFRSVVARHSAGGLLSEVGTDDHPTLASIAVAFSSQALASSKRPN
jgi:hypothetical protein